MSMLILLHCQLFMQPFPENRLLRSPSQVIRTLNVSESRIVAPLDVISVEHVVTFPEGVTLDVSLIYSVVLRTADPILSRFVISEPFSTEVSRCLDVIPNDRR